MKKLIILGTGPESARVMEEAERDRQFEVVAFIEEQPAAASHLDRPLHALEDASRLFQKGETLIFACATEHYLNQERLALYMTAKRSGFRVAGIVSSAAHVSREVRIRENVFVDAGVRVLRGANIGANTWILKGASVGANTHIGSSCWIGEESILADDVTLEKNCTLAERVLVRRKVTLPEWSSVNRSMVLETSPAETVFFDPLFRAPVILHKAVDGKPRES